MKIVSNTNQSKIKYFIIQYVFQSAIYSIQMERNRRRALLIKMLDKDMRDRFTVIRRKGCGDYKGEMVFWFATRQRYINKVYKV